jgi:hypothetical protein
MGFSRSAIRLAFDLLTADAGREERSDRASGRLDVRLTPYELKKENE